MKKPDSDVDSLQNFRKRSENFKGWLLYVPVLRVKLVAEAIQGVVSLDVYRLIVCCPPKIFNYSNERPHSYPKVSNSVLYSGCAHSARCAV